MAIFEALREHAEEIETGYGGGLSWEPLEAKRGCRIAARLDGGGYRDEDEWAQIQDEMIDRMIRLEGALRPFIHSLTV